MSGLLGYPAPVYKASNSPFDIAGIAAQIDQAASSLGVDERGSLTVQVNQDNAGAWLIVRLPGPLSPKILAQVTKPKAGPFGWSVSGRISFLTSPQAVRFCPELRGMYRLFREYRNTRIGAAVKAVAVNAGREVRLSE